MRKLGRCEADKGDYFWRDECEREGKCEQRMLKGSFYLLPLLA